ncbi:MAG TPA: histidine--tRNA ligase [Candidatus Saccharimonadales bacterium]|nr:histidine--tRNA ligase [Candidatus Saccharimonadales bacterium]
MNVSLPRGTRDYSPSEAILLNKITGIIEETFKSFGFYPLDTPGIELMETLNGKAYGEDARKELYVLEGKEEGLRYDFTVPLARHMAMNRDIPLPFKRYQIGKVWRMDEPQKMRAREFIQADIDVVGSSEPISDAESIAAVAVAIEKTGVADYTVFINSRAVLDAVLNLFGVPKERHIEAIRALDKLSKIGREDVAKQIVKLGAEKGKTEALLDFIGDSGENKKTIDKLMQKVPEAKEAIGRLSTILSLIERYKLKGKMTIDLSLARGLDYYTGGIWEFVVFEEGKRLPTIASGGRYDNLMEMYSRNSVPAVGTAIGVSRLFEVLDKGEILRTNSKVHVAYIKEENLEYAMEVANQMRQAGIYVDLGVTKRALSKQLEYVNSMRIRHVAILGNQEREAKKVKLRDMISGEEELLGIDEAISRLRNV